MFGPKHTDPNLEKFRRWWGTWYGKCSLPTPYGDLDLVLEIPRNESIEEYTRRATNVVTRFGEFKDGLAQQLFDDYEVYKRADIKAGGFTEHDYKKYPIVDAPADVWNVLKPRQFWLGHTIDKYCGNSYLLIDVKWPNPHFFQVFLQLDSQSWKHMYTELVG